MHKAIPRAAFGTALALGLAGFQVVGATASTLGVSLKVAAADELVLPETPAPLLARSSAAPCAAAQARLTNALQTIGVDRLAADEASLVAAYLLAECGWTVGRLLAEAEHAS